MNLNDLHNETKKATTIAGQIAFLPWLELKDPVQIAGVEFVPYAGAAGDVSAVFKDAAASLTMIFSSYVNRDGNAVDSPVVATIRGSWNLSDDDVETVAWAARLLYLSCFAANEYFVDGGGRYVNSVLFRPVFQRFSGGPWIGVTSRRRYGSSLNGGYQHGEIKFNVPIQCTIEKATVDEPLIKALDAAHASVSSKTMGLLSTALPYVELANTDDDLMSEAPEAILMGSAFEQLLEGNASAYTLATNFGDLFKPFGCVTVAEALNVKPAIRIDPDPNRSAAQRTWWVHKKWIEELYGLRNESTHEGPTARSARGRLSNIWLSPRLSFLSSSRSCLNAKASTLLQSRTALIPKRSTSCSPPTAGTAATTTARAGGSRSSPKKSKTRDSKKRSRRRSARCHRKQEPSERK